MNLSNLKYSLKNPNQNPLSVALSSDITIGDNSDPILIAGPCTLESYDQTLRLGLAVKKAGALIFRGSAFKLRTSPYQFSGFEEEALIWHKEAQKQHHLLIETEVTDPRHVELASNYVDILRVGARNMFNFPLLIEIAKTGKPCILKRCASATLEEWLCAAEYILNEPKNGGVILCERGIRTFEDSTRYTLDLNTLVLLKELSWLPIIVDPSHAAGKRSLVLPLAAAGLAAGAHGLIIEVHDNPKEAVCDGNQQISPESLQSFSINNSIFNFIKK